MHTSFEEEKQFEAHFNGRVTFLQHAHLNKKYKKYEDKQNVRCNIAGSC